MASPTTPGEMKEQLQDILRELPAADKQGRLVSFDGVIAFILEGESKDCLLYRGRLSIRGPHKGQPLACHHRKKYFVMSGDKSFSASFSIRHSVMCSGVIHSDWTLEERDRFEPYLRAELLSPFEGEARIYAK